jgi:hypothetical protein
MCECIHKRQDGGCEILSDDEVTEYCVEGPCPRYEIKGKGEENPDYGQKAFRN